MSFLLPAALGFLALVPVIIVFYILRAQHQQQQVPSIRFWRQITSDLEGRPSRRIPLLNLLLLLQIIVVAALALALARPALVGGSKRNEILILDAAASMQSTDVAPSRFEEAKREIRTLLAGLNAGDGVTLIRAARSPSILDTSTGPDRSSFLNALATATASSGASDMVSAIALASSLAGQAHDAQNEIVVLSDGVFPTVDLAKLGMPPASVRLQLVGSSGQNVAITELAVRPMLGTIGRNVAFVRVANFGDQPVEVPMKSSADGIVIEQRTLQLPARGAAELTINLPTGTNLYEASLDTHDILKLDDRAQAVVGVDRPLRVSLVSSNTFFWERALNAVPNIKLTRIRPNAYKGDPADVTIFDGFEPPLSQWPAGNVLVVDPTAANPGDLPNLPIQPSGETGAVQIVSADRQSPLLDGIDLSSLVIPKSLKVRMPAWAHSVANSSEGSLILEGELDGRRVVSINFDPTSSELPQRLAFPILVANVLQYLQPTGLPSSTQPGTIVAIQPVAGASQIVVRMPSGKAQAFESRNAAIRFAQTDVVGRYVVTQWGDPATKPDGSKADAPLLDQQTFVVDATDELASDVRPHADAIKGATNVAQPGEVAPGVRQEVWPYLAALAFAALCFEWWYYSRRRTLAT